MKYEDKDRQGSYGALVRLGIWIALVLWIGLAAALFFALASDALDGAKVAQSKDLIGPLVTGTGVLIAVFAFLRDRDKISKDRQEAKSKILYEQAKSGLEDAYSLLQDQNNDRITWVRAARVIANSRELGNSIASSEYQEAYRLAEDAVRARLYEALTVKGDGGQRNALPPAFFFGHPEWRTCKLSLDQLAIETSSPVRVFSVTRDHIVPDIPSKTLAGRSVVAVMELLRYPEDYRDPLDEVDNGAWEKWPDSWGALQGAQRYLAHLKQYTAFNGKLIPRPVSTSTTTTDP